jgi:hypothetical protein
VAGLDVREARLEAGNERSGGLTDEPVANTVPNSQPRSKANSRSHLQGQPFPTIELPQPKLLINAFRCSVVASPRSSALTDHFTRTTAGMS